MEEKDNDLENAVFREKIKGLTPGKDGRVDIKINNISAVRVKLDYLQRLKDPIGYIERGTFKKIDNRAKKYLLQGKSIKDISGLISYIHKVKGEEYVEELIRLFSMEEDEYVPDEETGEEYDVTIPEIDKENNYINFIKI